MLKVNLIVFGAFFVLVSTSSSRTVIQALKDPVEIEIGYIPWSVIFRIEPNKENMPKTIHKVTVSSKEKRELLHRLVLELKMISSPIWNPRMYLIFKDGIQIDTVYIGKDCEVLSRKAAQVEKAESAISSGYNSFAITGELLLEIRGLLSWAEKRQVFTNPNCLEKIKTVYPESNE